MSNETMLMSVFSVKHQQEIVQEIYAKWNTSHPDGIRCALSDAAWQGFLIGLELAKDSSK